MITWNNQYIENKAFPDGSATEFLKRELAECLRARPLDGLRKVRAALAALRVERDEARAKHLALQDGVRTLKRVSGSRADAAALVKARKDLAEFETVKKLRHNGIVAEEAALKSSGDTLRVCGAALGLLRPALAAAIEAELSRERLSLAERGFAPKDDVTSTAIELLRSIAHRVAIAEAAIKCGGPDVYDRTMQAVEDLL